MAKKKTFLSLFRNPFFRNKESVEEYIAKKKGEAQVMMEAVHEILRKERGRVSESIAEMDGGDEEVYLYDFISEFGNDTSGGFITVGGAEGHIVGINNVTVNGSGITAISSNIEKIEPKIKLKPIDVFHELEKVPAPILLENLEEKIMVLKMKKDFIKNNRYAKKEVIDMITRLENRTKYKEFEKFFSRFDNTTTDKINALVNKYELVLKTSDLFIPKFPKDAMEIMNDYKENVKKLCGKSPVFYVIAEKAMFKAEEKRNDPILLVQSPFGMYWQILGAWDKELVLLEEL